MHMTTQPKKVVASAVISELQSSDIYLTLVARLFDLRANLNGVRVTEAFLDEIIENEAKYICHPLYADIRGLISGRTVGHMYNSRTGEFHTAQIGAFYHFEKETDGDNAHLIGYARVPKRNKALCKALSDLFADNALKFSFEVNCGVYSEEEDGTLLIDADERNYWEGECVVSFPACETAIARQLIAECLGKGDENMADENIVNAETEIQETEPMQSVVAENNEADETQVAQVETAETETAETVYVTQEHTEMDNVRAYNCDTGEEIEQRVVVNTTVRTPIEIAEENQDDDEDEQEQEQPEDEDDDEEVVASAGCEEQNPDEDDEEDEKAVASTDPDWGTLIAELHASIESLRKEIAELKMPDNAADVIVAEVAKDMTDGESDETIVAEQADDGNEEPALVNPFMASITAPKKYTLLETEEKPAHKYSLLERA